MRCTDALEELLVEVGARSALVARVDVEVVQGGPIAIAEFGAAQPPDLEPGLLCLLAFTAHLFSQRRPKAVEVVVEAAVAVVVPMKLKRVARHTRGAREQQCAFLL